MGSLGSPEVETAGEAGAGGIFQDSKSRHADLRAMLDSSKENLKMEAMRRIIVMVAKGRDASDLFPAVVKNVAAKNLELKKLVYVYLERYAEEQQDLALLSISTFQRGLKDPNQLIRASALRVLSSIRVPMISPILMLALKESMRDMSPYVRKVAAHAIPKLYALDPEAKEELVGVIDHLLADKATLVTGSAVYAFEELCPERTHLLHAHFRRLAAVLVDVDEWGQVIIINTLTRYARSQFTDPNLADGAAEAPEKFYSESEEDEASSRTSSGSGSSESEKETEAKRTVDPDLRALLRNAKPLLQSRNAAVVLAVAQLYYHCGPAKEAGVLARALVRLLRSHPEVQAIILTNIATISAKRPVHLYAISKNMFEPFLKSFLVRSSDGRRIKELKLEILTNLATSTNIGVILRELQTYVGSADGSFAAATIDAIGRCAAKIPDVADVCLSGLLGLIRHSSEVVVAQALVVIKKLLLLQPQSHKDIILSSARLIDRVRLPHARASIVSLVGEYAEEVADVAPDVLRRCALSFVHEDDSVKLQVLNLAVRLFLLNRAQTGQLVHYVFSLARYDQSYDIRDRARFLRNLVFPDKPNKLSRFSAQIFLAKKPAPAMGLGDERDGFQLGSLSHLLNQRCEGYQDLDDFPDEAPDPTVRDVQGFESPTQEDAKLSPYEAVQERVRKRREEEAFYSSKGSSSGSSESTSGSGESSEESGSSEDSSEDSQDDDSDQTSSSDDDKPKAPPPKPTKAVNKSAPKAAAQPKPSKKTGKKEAKETATDLLLDLDFGGGDGGGAALQPAALPAAPLTATSGPVKPTSTSSSPREGWETGPAEFVPDRSLELVNKVGGGGLSVSARFTRSPSIYAATAVSVQLHLSNQSDKPFAKISLGEQKLPEGMSVLGWPGEGLALGAGASTTVTLGVDFADTTQALPLELGVETEDGVRKVPLKLGCPVGEQLRPVLLSPAQFRTEQGKLSGLNETSGTLEGLGAGLSLEAEGAGGVGRVVQELGNVGRVAGTGQEEVWLAGQTVSGRSLLLVSLAQGPKGLRLRVNCDKLVIGSMLFKQIKAAITQK